MQSYTTTKAHFPSQSSSPKNILLIVGIGTAAVGLVMIALIIALASGASFAVSRIRESRQQEGKETIKAIAAAAVAYANDPHAHTVKQLPETTTVVPASLTSVSGVRYISKADDWNAPGWKRLKFTFTGPQTFQYQWERSTNTSGVARAIGDLDVDKNPDVILELPVTCTTSPAWQCSVGTLRKAL